MRSVRRRAPASLFWRMFGANALVFIGAGLILALSPLTVSSPITLAEATTLVAGIALMLLINLWLMRRSYAPLAELANTMRRIDPLKPGQRVGLQTQDRELGDLVASFNDMLDRLETERYASAKREAESTDAEQRRIAGELHDEIGQQLTVLLLMLANAQTDADSTTATRLDHARALAHDVLDDLRAVVMRLRPEALDQLGLPKALDALAASIERQTGVQVSTRLCELNVEVSPIIALVVYRVAQEALTNAVRHARGSAVVLELERDDGWLRLAVRDRGPGLPAGEARERGTGLRLMAERALLIDAKLDLDSSSDGTNVMLSIPDRGDR